MVKLPLPLVVIEPVNPLPAHGASALFFLRPMRFGTRHSPGGPTVGPGLVDSSGSGGTEAERIAEDDRDSFGIDVDPAAEDPREERRDEVEGVGDRHAVRVVGFAARKGDLHTAADTVRVPGEVDAWRLVADVPLDVAGIRAAGPIDVAARAAGAEQGRPPSRRFRRPRARRRHVRGRLLPSEEQEEDWEHHSELDERLAATAQARPKAGPQCLDGTGDQRVGGLDERLAAGGRRRSRSEGQQSHRTSSEYLDWTPPYLQNLATHLAMVRGGPNKLRGSSLWRGL